MSDIDVLVWSKNSPLQWSDFKAESHPAAFEDAHSVIKYRYTWTVNSEKMGSEVVFFIENIELFTEFHRLLSWVKIPNANHALLKHEQGHFDLAELVKRENLEKLQKIFYGKNYPTRGKNEEQRKQFAKEDSGRMIGKEVEELEKQLLERLQDYDDQTNFGQNSGKQSEFNMIFDKL